MVIKNKYTLILLILTGKTILPSNHINLAKQDFTAIAKILNIIAPQPGEFTDHVSSKLRAKKMKQSIQKILAKRHVNSHAQFELEKYAERIKCPEFLIVMLIRSSQDTARRELCKKN